MRPHVDIQAHNNKSGLSREIERTALFVGIGDKNTNQLISLSNESDLDELFGETEFKEQVKAAMLNAGSNWFAYAYVMPLDDYNFEQAVKIASENAKFEYAVNTNTLDVSASSLILLQGIHSELMGKYGRRIFIIQAIEGISEGENWSTFLKNADNLTKGVAADHVMVVPNLFGNDVGVLAGRLANRAVTVADTPARVKTGALIHLGRGERPTDSEGVMLDLSHIESLDRSRISCVTYYPDYDGFYWGDGVTLDVEGGDYQSIENVRVVDKVCRRVRIMAISKIGDRSLNSSVSSIELHKQLFSDVMREMSQTVQIGNNVFYGECYPPNDDSVEIVWKNKNTVAIYLTIQPIECPKAITVAVMLDLNLKGE